MKPTHRDSSDEDLSDLLDDELTDSSTENGTTNPSEFPVDDASVGQRLDQFLTARLPISRHEYSNGSIRIALWSAAKSATREP